MARLAPIPIDVRSRIFPAWSIDVPPTFNEALIPDAGWHGYDECRSISLTSVVLTDEGAPVPANRILDELAAGLPLEGEQVDELPAGLPGSAVIADAIPPARASKILSGLLAADGRVLVVTITSDDLAWARRTWLSIRYHPSPVSTVPEGGPAPEARHVH
ncbi:MAG TPA: hypothetical protein VGK63_11190 [Candidatus Limnocylindrales bacterium]